MKYSLNPAKKIQALKKLSQSLQLLTLTCTILCALSILVHKTRLWSPVTLTVPSLVSVRAHSALLWSPPTPTHPPAPSTIEAHSKLLLWSPLTPPIYLYRPLSKHIAHSCGPHSPYSTHLHHPLSGDTAYLFVPANPSTWLHYPL